MGGFSALFTRVVRLPPYRIGRGGEGGVRGRGIFFSSGFTNFGAGNFHSSVAFRPEERVVAHRKGNSCSGGEGLPKKTKDHAVKIAKLCVVLATRRGGFDRPESVLRRTTSGVAWRWGVGIFAPAKSRTPPLF